MKTAAQPEKSEQWVVVAAYSGMAADMEADYVVSMLKGSRIPAVRLPVEPAPYPLGGGVVLDPVRVLVPPDRAEEAKELLTDAESDSEAGE